MGNPGNGGEDTIVEKFLSFVRNEGETYYALFDETYQSSLTEKKPPFTFNYSLINLICIPMAESKGIIILSD